MQKRGIENKLASALIYKVYRDIKHLNIQGAENIAMAALDALAYSAQQIKAASIRGYFKTLKSQKDILVAARSTEPELKNLLSYFIANIKNSPIPNIEAYKKVAAAVYGQILKLKDIENKEIISNGMELISHYKKHKNLSKIRIFTHCHSSTVVAIIANTAKKLGAGKIIVNNTETRPLFQGRKTALELAKAGIKVNHFIDSAGRVAIKNSDLCLFGADLITKNKIVNKIGTEMFCEVAKNYNTPVYICSSIWKYHPTMLPIEERNKKEVWGIKQTNKQKITIKNYAFEAVRFKLIKGIICEYGVLKPKKFVRYAKRFYKTTNH